MRRDESAGAKREGEEDGGAHFSSESYADCESRRDGGVTRKKLQQSRRLLVCVNRLQATRQFAILWQAVQRGVKL